MYEKGELGLACVCAGVSSKCLCKCGVKCLVCVRKARRALPRCLVQRQRLVDMEQLNAAWERRLAEELRGGCSLTTAS